MVYVGAAAIVAMYFVVSVMVDGVLALIAVASTVAACPIGMRHDENLSDFTNRIRRAAYPLCVVGALFFIAVNYMVWNT